MGSLLWNRLKYGLDYFLDYFKTIFLTILSGGSTPLVLREGWDAVYQYTEEGLGGSVITQGGVRDEL